MLLSSFTGLAYVDIMLLHPHHIGRTADGRRYIRINRKKTNVEAFIPLHPIAEQILDLYNTTDDTKPVFPTTPRTTPSPSFRFRAVTRCGSKYTNWALR